MTFQHVTRDGVNRAFEVREFPAGKSINAARVLHVLDADPLAIGFLGGHTGRFIREELDRLALKHDFLETEPATRTCVTVVDRSAGTATELIEEPAVVPDEIYTALLAKLGQHLHHAKALLLSGALPRGAPPDFYARCVAGGIGAGAVVVLDAKGESLKLALACKPTVVKPNRSELEETLEMKIDSPDLMKTAIRRLITAGPRWVVVTDGAKETIASDGESFWKISTPKVPVISAIGSGDSFAAGLTAALTARQALPQACRLAAACGAANAMTAFAGHVRSQDVNLLLSGISVTPF
jgi:tagatose 6-phosphate kinase